MALASRPIIGLVLDEMLDPPKDGSAFSRRPFYALRMDYFAAIARAGGAPIAVPYELDALSAYLRVCDGWLVPGGDYRFRPDWYETPPPVFTQSLRRDFEIAVMTRLLAADAPVLGVCNGMQVMAGVTGGKISYIGHQPRAPGSGIAHGDPATGIAHHDVDVAPGSRLAALLGAQRVRTNSAHKEDVVRVGVDVSISARAGDGVIEAIEIAGRRFALGVQWHPELDGDDRLIGALVEAARGV